MTEYVQRVAMKAVIVKDGKILLLREAATYEEGTNIGRYEIPGGRINPGEHWKDGLLREIQEETGIIDIAIGEPLLVSEWFPVIKGVPTHIVAMFHMCQTTSDTVILSSEHDHAIWVSADDWQKYDPTDPESEVLKKAFNIIAS